MRRAMVAAIALTLLSAVTADQADVVDVEVICRAETGRDIDVTAERGDEDREHSANRWEVLALDGEVLATRELAHRHENEQPFMRSLRGVRIPDGVDQLVVHANDSVHGFGGAPFSVNLRWDRH